MRFYAKIIVRHSYLVILVVTIFSLLLSAIPLILLKFPSFSDPVAGFETRGTELAARFIAWENLIEESRPSQKIGVNPKDIQDELRMNRTLNVIEKYGKKKKHRTSKNKKKNKVPKIVYEQDLSAINHSSHEHFSYDSNITYIESEMDLRIKDSKDKQWHALKNFSVNENSFKNVFTNNEDYFCSSPVPDYAHYVVETYDQSSLLNYDNVMSICKLQTKITLVDRKLYEAKCDRPLRSDISYCCPVWSLPNYIAALSNKTNCANLISDDVTYVSELLQKCAPYFHSLKLQSDCVLNKCEVPPQCSKHNAVYNILFHIIDIFAFPENDTLYNYIRKSMVFMPLPCSGTTLSYYLKLTDKDLFEGKIQVAAMEFGLKNSLFDMWLIEDMWLVALGGLFVFVWVWLYVGSLFLTIMIFIAICYSLGIAYFIYVYIYQLDFFPFMNLLVAVIVIGIGADDAFIFMKIWESVKSQILGCRNREQICISGSYLTNSETVLIDIVHESMKHSIMTMFVTTITTSVAFFASYISNIPAINCFSVFAGTAVMVNFILLMMWLPASVFILETKIGTKLNFKCRFISKNMSEMWSDLRRLFVYFISQTISKCYFLWLFLLGIVGILSCVVVFHYPGLNLPDSKYFQLFRGDHLFERYDSVYKDYFLFEHFNKEWAYGGKLPLRWVWGVKAVDNGNIMNPSSKGFLELDPTFNMSHPDSQVFLKNFCANLKSEMFYQSTLGPMLANCFIESFISWMDRPCLDTINNNDRSPCCETSYFPYKPEVFDICIVKAVESLYQTPRQFFIPGVAGPKFLKKSQPLQIVALVVEFESTQSFTMSYTEMDNFYKTVEHWTQKQLETAPSSMKNGWFLSDLQFYDLQNTLASGTLVALGLSSALGFLILVPSTLSFTLSLCGVIAMGFSVTVTIAVLILMGWKLNILESIAISTSAGLAVDFTLHYTLSYSHSKGPRKGRALSALTSSISPTAAAAITTGFSGIFLVNSNILPYRQIGLFFAVIMAVSWIYATWFLCSLLYIFGPHDKNTSLKDVPISASGVTSICSGLPNLESHEMNNLTNSNVIAPKSPSNISAITVMLHSSEACRPLNADESQVID